MSHIIRSTKIEAQIDDVWAYFVESDKIQKWLLKNTFEAAVGHQFTMDSPEGIGSGAPIACEVKELSPPQNGKARLVYTWVIDQPLTQTLLEIDLIEISGVTNVDIVHSGWASDDDVRQRHADGWTHLLENVLTGLLAAQR